MKPKTIITHTITLIVGIILGALGLLGWYLLQNNSTTIMKTKQTIHAGNGIVIPEGTELIYNDSMSEGFERAMLYINIDPILADKAFEYIKDNRSFLIIPYWAKDE